MIFFITLIVGLVEAGGAATWLWFSTSKGSRKTNMDIAKLQKERDTKEAILKEIEELSEKFIPFRTLHQKVAQLRGMRESLKVEKGRVSITQAELETVETRLRELEEIERELGASRLETEEEKKILDRKDRDLKSKNEGLNEQIKNVEKLIDQAISEFPISDEDKEKFKVMKERLIASGEHTTKLIEEIEGTSKQYFIVKARYDALDIEYAQLYEKFADVESQQNKESK